VNIDFLNITVIIPQNDCNKAKLWVLMLYRPPL